MKKFIQQTIRFIFVTTVLMFVGIISSFAADLQMFSEVRLINDPSNDGDSFLVEAHGNSLHIRLYFVDCPEISITFKSGAERVREQTRYFGLSGPTRTIHFGNEAKTFTEHVLLKPFTVHTAFASALGRSTKGRVYGFIITADGNDLASLLIKNGLARTHGKGRETPNEITQNEMVERLRDLETSAMIKHIGIWSESDPDRIAGLRAKQRSEDQELKELQSQVKKPQLPQSVLDLNTASKKELESIKGIGPVLAERILAGRPYVTVDDLFNVKGIGPKILDHIRPYFVVGKIGVKPLINGQSKEE